MAGHLIAANQINAQTAGITDPAMAAPNPGTLGTGGPVPAEIQSNLIHTAGGAISSIVSGGSHPETLPVPVSTQLVKATDSLTGKLGGLVPRSNGMVAPGPQGGTNAAHAIQAVSTGVTQSYETARQRMRRLLGVKTLTPAERRAAHLQAHG